MTLFRSVVRGVTDYRELATQIPRVNRYPPRFLSLAMQKRGPYPRGRRTLLKRGTDVERSSIVSV